jgi:dihydrofolate synthase/folylpolyglutamate synthase
MDANKIKSHLFSLNSKGIKYDLNRITEAAHRLGDPFLSYRCFHVAGTNGKGSTCAYLESILRCSGFRTGLFTSPHLINFEERFHINGLPVKEEQWVEVYCELQEVIEEFNLTFFEATTLMAFELFKKNGVQWAVFETGLGGRLDATNVIKPDVSIITKIDIDHIDLLGSNIVSIANEKFGIIKDGTPAVTVNNPDTNVMALFRNTCSKKNAPYSIVSLSDKQEKEDSIDGTFFIRKGENYRTRLGGDFQEINALLALEAIELAGLYNAALCKDGIAKAFMPCRFQCVEYNGKPLIFDVGHNPDASIGFINNIRRHFAGKHICIVTGIMKDKNFTEILLNYVNIADRIILCKPNVDRAASPESLLHAIALPDRSKCEIAGSVEDALNSAFRGLQDVICVTGSFYTVGEACSVLKFDPFSGIFQTNNG